MDFIQKNTSNINKDSNKNNLNNKDNKNNKNIDEKHTDIMNIFFVLEKETIPKLINEKNMFKKRINQFERNGKQYTDEYLEMKDKIEEIREEIRDLKIKKKKYLLENSKYIFNYYEEKQKISNGKNMKNMDSINQFFKIKAKTEESTDINSDKYKSSKKIYQEYWKNVEGEITHLQEYVLQTDTCLLCNQGELIPQEEEGILICNNVECGKFILHIVDNQKPVNKEMPNEVSYTAYIRLNHFKEILSQFQAKETTKIPDEVIDAIRKRIQKERRNINEINYKEMRNILSILGYNKYFEHIQYINSMLGIQPPVMDDELIETLCILFIEIQQPWALFCPITRTNFFNYTYILCQLCILLDQRQYLPFIPMMKDRIKQLEQDMIWKKVCDYLDWEYFPTV
jgi:hypothetical protein